MASLPRAIQRSPSPVPKKSISINLLDLNKKHDRTAISPCIPPPQQSKSDILVSDLLGNEKAYEKELLKLLEKAKGTAYEASMRKFIANKLGKEYTPPDNAYSETASYGTEEEQELLNHSKYMKQRQKIDMLAQPLHRTEPETTPRKFNYMSTNNLGRQRPPPTQADHRKPIGSGPISVREFNSWLRRTNRWKQSLDESICSEKQAREAQESAENFRPRIGHKSIVLAKRAHSREIQQRTREGGLTDTTNEHEVKPLGTGMSDGRTVFYSVDSDDGSANLQPRVGIKSTRTRERLASDASSAQEIKPLPTGMSDGRTVFFSVDADDVSDIADDDRSEKHVEFYNQGLSTNQDHSTRDLQSPSIIVPDDSKEKHHEHRPARSMSPASVYDRLSARGRDYAQRRLHWAPPQPPFSFKPDILVKSKLIVDKKRGRSRSVERPALNSTNDVTTLENTNPLNNMALEPDATPHADGAVSQLSSSQGTEQRRGRSLSKGAVQTVKSSKQYTNTELTFQPRVSRESKRIVARKNETFEDRLNKSVENFHVLSIVSKRSGSPGPGYYSNISIPAATSRSSRSVSPGKAGYSFGKYTKDLDLSLKY